MNLIQLYPPLLCRCLVSRDDSWDLSADSRDVTVPVFKVIVSYIIGGVIKHENGTLALNEKIEFRQTILVHACSRYGTLWDLYWFERRWSRYLPLVHGRQAQ